VREAHEAAQKQFEAEREARRIGRRVPKKRAVPNPTLVRCCAPLVASKRLQHRQHVHLRGLGLVRCVPRPWIRDGAEEHFVPNATQVCVVSAFDCMSFAVNGRRRGEWLVLIEVTLKPSGFSQMPRA
jgi:hypothetical protein